MADSRSSDPSAPASSNGALGASPPAPMSDRINGEPAILKGLSSTEIVVAAAIFFPIWVAIGVLLGLLLGHLQIAVVLAFGGPMFSVWFTAGIFARIKRNRPQHYYWHLLVWWLHRFGVSAPFIAHQGHWALGRLMPAEPLELQRHWYRFLRACGISRAPTDTDTN